MRWIVKAALQKGMSALPAAESVNYLFQQHVTRSLPPPEATFRKKFSRALKHLAAYAEHGPRREIEEAALYEFGAGWDLAVQLSYWCLGVNSQTLVDIRPNLRLALVNETLRRLSRLRAELEEEAGRPVRDPGPADISSLGDLARRFGIEYLAPRDARATGLAARSIDLVSSTNTLEHIPARDVVPILAECRRLLREDGVLSSRIDLRDHYAYFDPSISVYNFLRYGERSWRWLNSDLLYQNRLRRPAYLAAFTEAGLAVVSEEAAAAAPADLAVLERMPIAPELRPYPLEELGVKGLDLVARPAPTGSPDALEEAEDVVGRRGTGIGLGARPDRGRLGDGG